MSTDTSTSPATRAQPDHTSGQDVAELVSRVAGTQPRAVARIVATMTGPDVHGKDVTELLQRIAELARAVIGDCDSAGVTVLQDGTPFTSAFTDERTPAVDRDRYDADRGPCLDAARAGVVVRATVEDSRQAWPEFTRAAVADGVRAFLAVPLQIEDVGFGALIVYSHDVDGFGDDDEALAVLIARIGAGLVAGQLQHHRSATLITQLEEAIASRALIEQAKGAVAVVRRITPDEAFGVLRTVSQESNVKLREIAARTLREFGAVLR